MTLYPQTTAFKDVTVILPVINETFSLRETVDVVLATSRPHVREILVVVADRTTPESMAVIADLSRELGDLVVVHRQKRKFLGGAMQEAFDLARGSHTLMMSSDLETDPAQIPDLIEAARRSPDTLTTVTRWKGGGFEGYNPVKLVANAIFQKTLGLIYSTRLTDMTFGYRIFPTRLIQAIRWEELRHPLMLESLVKPLRLGVPIEEISGRWRARVEGESQNTFMRNFEYFGIAWRVRFMAPSDILRQPPRAASPEVEAAPRI